MLLRGSLWEVRQLPRLGIIDPERHRSTLLYVYWVVGNLQLEKHGFQARVTFPVTLPLAWNKRPSHVMLPLSLLSELPYWVDIYLYPQVKEPTISEN